MGVLKGRTVVVTGASRGIGASAAVEYAEAGANVVLLARSLAPIAELAGRIGADRALAIPCDVSQYKAVEAAMEAAQSAFGSIDVLVNNAGVIEPIARLDEVDPEAWGLAVDINLRGVFNGIRAVLPTMIRQGGGTILNVSSGAASMPNEGWSQYCTAKAGAAMLLRCVDNEFRNKGIRALGLSPGTVATDMQRTIKASGVNRVSQLEWDVHIPPEWPARTLVWLATPDADEYLGTEISLRDKAILDRLGLA